MTRRGFSVLEVTVAGALLVAVLAICLQMLRATAAGHRARGTRQMAIIETGNVMERLSAVPWEDLTPQAARAMQLSPQARRGLTAAELEIEITQRPDRPGAKRIAVRVRWQDPAGRVVRPVRLVAWRYRR